jgi:hypothetical protein
MQTHLASCVICRNELKELRIVSDILKAAPAPQAVPVEHFVSQMTLNLPRRTLADRPPKPGSLAWWIVPAGLIGAWFFVQTLFTLTNTVTAIDLTGLLGKASIWLGGGQENIWLSAIANLFGGQTTGTVSLLNNVSVFGGGLLSGFLWQAAIVLLYWGWLAIWWLRRGPRPMKMHDASNV